jgi:hypothetical protein
VSATASQAAATTQARSSGEKIGLSAAAFAIDHGEITQRPPLSPASNLTLRHFDLSANLAIAEFRMLVNGQGQAISLDFLNECRASPNGAASGLQKIVSKGTRGWLWSRHDPPPCDSTDLRAFLPCTKYSAQPGRYL